MYSFFYWESKTNSRQMLLKRLYSSIKYEDLNAQDKTALSSLWILNWFWWARQSKIIRFFLWLVLKKFSIAIADKHDYWYWLAIVPRKECDEKFFRAMIQDIVNIYEKSWWKLELIWNFYLCFIAYISIRLLGWKYYNK